MLVLEPTPEQKSLLQQLGLSLPSDSNSIANMVQTPQLPELILADFRLAPSNRSETTRPLPTAERGGINGVRQPTDQPTEVYSRSRTTAACWR